MIATDAEWGVLIDRIALELERTQRENMILRNQNQELRDLVEVLTNEKIALLAGLSVMRARGY